MFLRTVVQQALEFRTLPISNTAAVLPSLLLNTSCARPCCLCVHPPAGARL